MIPITRQAEYYGLPEPERSEAPAPEKIAEQLRPAPLWQGPARIEDRG